MDHDAQPADESTAKLWVKKPGGAIFRSESKGMSSAISLGVLSRSASFTVPSSDSDMLKANGVETHPPGSAGKLSRPGNGEAADISTGQCRAALTQ